MDGFYSTRLQALDEEDSRLDVRKRTQNFRLRNKGHNVKEACFEVFAGEWLPSGDLLLWTLAKLNGSQSSWFCLATCGRRNGDYLQSQPRPDFSLQHMLGLEKG